RQVLICMLHGGKFLQGVSERGGHGKVRRVVCIQLYDVGDRIFGDHPALQRGGYRSIIRAKDEVSVDPFQSPFWDGHWGGERPKRLRLSSGNGPSCIVFGTRAV